MKAIGVHIFAGSFTMGVQAAGFEVPIQVETHELGWDTARSLGVEIVRTPEVISCSDRRRKLGKVDFLFANPRCSCFSTMSTGAPLKATRGHGGKPTADIREVMAVEAEVRPKVLAMESVQQALSVGRPLIAEVAKELMNRGYEVAHLLYANSSLGVPQVRKRYMLVASRIGRIDFTVPEMPAVVTVNQAFAKLPRVKGDAKSWGSREAYGPGDWYKVNDEYMKIIPEIQPGEGVMKLWTRDPGIFKRLKCPVLQAAVDRWKARGKGRPFGFDTNTVFRVKGDHTAPVVHGGCDKFLHPTLNRPMNVQELAALMCWPKGKIPIGPMPAYQIGKAVSPKVGEWIAEGAMRALIGEKSNKWSTQVRPEVFDDLPGQVVNFNPLAPKQARSCSNERVQ